MTVGVLEWALELPADSMDGMADSNPRRTTGRCEWRDFI